MFYKDLAIYLSYGLPSFSSSYSLVLLLQNKWQACQERGRNFPKLFMKWLAPSSLNPVGTLSSTRNTIITLSVPLPGSPHKNRFCDDEGVCGHSEPAQHSHHLHCAPCPRELLQCSPRWDTPLLPFSLDCWGPGLLAVPCMGLLSKSCPLGLVWSRKGVICVFILVSFDYLVLALLLLKKPAPSFLGLIKCHLSSLLNRPKNSQGLLMLEQIVKYFYVAINQCF